ncbi:MAG TPA: hypothetical protein VEP68_09670, partial [Anaeromyxobacteraceae bacterium]|nr:hypothetical protein [Anaeromyxobacteraceae bacterium]
PASLLLPALAALAACSSPEDRAARARLFSSGEERAAPAPFDWERPQRSLAMDADEASARLGSFDWEATVGWTVSRAKDGGERVHLVERHRLRQAASGEFEVQSDLDPGGQEGAETGKRIIWADKMTYARGRYAPSGAWRERPTDRGRDARRYRDESFGVAADLLSLAAPWKLTPAGEVVFLHRPARRFTVSLGEGARQASPAPADRASDPDTRRRFAFLEGREPVKLEGEVVADGASGAPLKVQLRAAFRVAGDPETRAEVELLAQVKAVGPAVAAVAPPREVLPDERKTRGVARALEAAGLRKRGEAAEEEEGAEEPE